MGDDKGVRLLKRDQCWNGYTLVQSRFEQAARLIDLEGHEVHRWEHELEHEALRDAYFTGWHYAEMLPNGHLLAIIKEVENGFPGVILELDWHSNLLWQADVAAHHDFERLDNGNTLVVCREYVENSFIGSGRIKSDSILSLSPDGEIVWEWHVDRHAEQIAELVNVQFPRKDYDWAHTNTVEALPPNAAAEKDDRFRQGNVLFSSRNIDTVGVIDGRTGEVVWAWGPGIIEKQHMPTMLSNGHLLIFDNGCYRGSSAVVEMDPISEEIVWKYEGRPPESFHSYTRGANQRLPNGNTLITESDREGHVFEVTPDGETVWDYWNTDLTDDGEGQPIYRAMRHAAPAVDRLLSQHK